MNEILLSAGVVVFSIYAGFNIAHIMNMKRTSDSMREFLANVGDNVHAVLDEIKGTVENVRKISDDARKIVADIKQISHAVTELETAVRDRLRYVDRTATSSADQTVPD